jgi:hypothetical protein
VKYRPITVNIEVKVPGGGGKNEAMVQIAVWAAAQMEKRGALTGTGKLAAIGIPLVSVEGHDWRFYQTYQQEDGDMVLRGNGLFGDSSSILGILLEFGFWPSGVSRNIDPGSRRCSSQLADLYSSRFDLNILNSTSIYWISLLDEVMQVRKVYRREENG